MTGIIINIINVNTYVNIMWYMNLLGFCQVKNIMTFKIFIVKLKGFINKDIRTDIFYISEENLIYRSDLLLFQINLIIIDVKPEQTNQVIEDT